MNCNKIIPITQERPSSLSEARKERAERDKERLFVYMRELHEASVAVGKPNLLVIFLNSLADISMMWGLEEREKKKAERR